MTDYNDDNELSIQDELDAFQTHISRLTELDEILILTNTKTNR